MRLSISAALLLLFTSTVINATDFGLRLNPLFSDNMLIQQGRGITVWGTDYPNSKVHVDLSGNKAVCTADKYGKWRVTLPEMTAGGPYQMEIIGSGKKLIKNIMIGELWLASGQSNMEISVYSSKNAKDEISNANYPQIRLFTVEKNVSTDPREQLKGMWAECTPQSVKNFSAVAYFFGRRLHKSLNVPVGLINSSWGGTPADSWTSFKALSKDSDFSQILKRRADAIEFSKTQKAKGGDGSEYVDPGISHEALSWHLPNYDDSKWDEVNLPTKFSNLNKGLFDGAVWFRRTVVIPQEFANKSLKICLGKIQNYDMVFFNGEKIGQTNSSNSKDAKNSRCYSITPGVVKPGENSITVRIFNSKKGGGFCGKAEDLKITADNMQNSLSLAGKWKSRISVSLPMLYVYGTQDPYLPCGLYNSMIYPLRRFPIKGAIWYQGESNVWRAHQYRKLFPNMIESWRDTWGYEFPFLFVQLASFCRHQPGRQLSASALSPKIAEDEWAELREAQLLTLKKTSNTGMAVTIDIGDANDVHPKNKQDVGLRLALWAEAKVYKRDIVFSGPVYSGAKKEKDKIRVFFDHVGSGLVLKGDSPIHLAIAGKNRKFVWAKAEIDGDTLLVFNPAVKNPVAVRYAWQNWPAGCNLFNKEGLPASPFRTDNWRGKSFGKK